MFPFKNTANANEMVDCGSMLIALHFRTINVPPKQRPFGSEAPPVDTAKQAFRVLISRFTVFPVFKNR